MLKNCLSGHFWLKLLVLGVGSALVLVGILQFLLLWIFDATSIEQRLTERFEPLQRNITFSGKISRHWLPEPGFVLDNVRISEPNSQKTAIEIGTMSYHFSWLDLIKGIPKISHLTLQGANTKIIKNQDTWNIADIVTLFNSNQQSRLSSLLIENSQLDIISPADNINIGFRDFNANLDDLQDNSHPFSFSSTATLNSNHTVKINSDGYLSRDKQLWKLDNWNSNLIFSLPYLYQTDVTLNTAAALDLQDVALHFTQPKININNQNNHLSVTLKGDTATWINNAFSMPNAQGNSTYQTTSSNTNSTVALRNIHWQNSLFKIDEVKSQTNLQLSNSNTIINAKMGLDFSSSGQFQLKNLALDTRQNYGEDLLRSRLISNWQGNAEGLLGQDWILNLQGELDENDANIHVRFQQQNEPTWVVNADLAKWDITPYLALQGDTDNDLILNQTRLGYLSKLKDHVILGSLKVGHFQLATWSAEAFSSDILVNKSALSLQNMKAKLYHGNMSGSLSIQNTQPPQFTTEQSFQNINIHQWMQTFGQFTNLEGQGDAYLQGTASGNTWAALRQSLTGEAKMNIRNGKLIGIDFKKLLQQAQTQSVKNQLSVIGYNPEVSTTFNAITSQMNITNGQSDNHIFHLVSDSIRVNGMGKLQLSDGNLDYRLHLADRQSSFLNLPMRITGTLNKPAITIDYNTLTLGMNNTEQKKDVLKNAIMQQWQLMKSLPAIKTD